MDKIKSDLKKLTCTQKALADALELSQARIVQLIEEKVVVVDDLDKSRGVFVVDSLRNYYLSTKASDSGVSYWKEKSLHEKAKRKKAEIEVNKMQGEVYSASAVEDAFAEVLTTLRNNLLGLPQKFAVQLENKSRADINSILTAEIEQLLDEVSSAQVKRHD